MKTDTIHALQKCRQTFIKNVKSADVNITNSLSSPTVVGVG